jgi:hypothetical protein
MEENTTSYLSIPNSDSPLNVFDSPQADKPIPLPPDFEFGTFWRFFCQRINTGEIIETNSDSFLEIEDINPLFDCFKLQWAISGPQRNTTVNGAITFGVYEKNQKVTEEFNRQYTGLDKILNNPLEYWRGF